MDLLLCFLCVIFLGAQIWKMKHPPAVKALLSAGLLVLFLLSRLDIPAVKYPLATISMAAMAVLCWNIQKYAVRDPLPFLVLWSVIFGFLPIAAVIRQVLPGTYPYRGEGWQENIFYCVISLPSGIASAVSLTRILLEKHGRNGQKEVD